ncbi:retrovirus-related pol polyprotein from transposon TNT 1-94 [Tanacetum coccineum]
MKSSPICLLSKASKNKSWLWYQRLSHLNFGTINDSAKQGFMRGFPTLNYTKDHLCSVCSLGKSKKHTHKPKSEDSVQEKLYLLHIDLCGPMTIESINRKNYILVIVDDYSRFNWVKFLQSKDETPKFIIKFLKQVKVRLHATVRNIHTDNETEFVNQTLKTYYEDSRRVRKIGVGKGLIRKGKGGVPKPAKERITKIVLKRNPITKEKTTSKDNPKKETLDKGKFLKAKSKQTKETYVDNPIELQLAELLSVENERLRMESLEREKRMMDEEIDDDLDDTLETMKT